MGEPRLPRLRDDGRRRQPRSSLASGRPTSTRPPAASTWLIRTHKPDVVTTYNEFGGYGHPDHIRTHDVAVRAFPRAGDATWYPEQLEAGLEPWAPSKLYEQATPASVRKAMNERLKEMGAESFWLPPKDATPEQLAEFEAFMAKMLVPDESITTWIDISEALDLKWEAIQRTSPRSPMDNPFMRLGLDGWREFWGKEAFILRESTVETSRPEIGPVRRAQLSIPTAATSSAMPSSSRSSVAAPKPWRIVRLRPSPS